MARVKVEDLRAVCCEALRAAGVSDLHTGIVADVLVTTDSWGVFTHGTKLLGGYLKRARAGGLRTDARPAVVSEGGAWALVDGGSTFGQVTGKFAMERAIEKARDSGIGYVGVRNSCHFGAAGYYAWLAARQNMIGQAMANDMPSMGAPGSKKAVTGTNPFAFAAPAGDHDPILLDMSLSTAAGGKVYAAHQRGEPIQEDWLIGNDGRPCNDGSLYPFSASLAPMAGYKGYGLAVMSEILTGVLPGAGITWEVGSWIFDAPENPTHHGAAFLAINVGAMMPIENFRARVDQLISEIHGVPTADDRPLMMPGEREWQHRRSALERGIELPEDVLESLASCLELAGVGAPAWLEDR